MHRSLRASQQSQQLGEAARSPRQRYPFLFARALPAVGATDMGGGKQVADMEERGKDTMEENIYIPTSPTLTASSQPSFETINIYSDTLSDPQVSTASQANKHTARREPPAPERGARRWGS